MAKGEEQTGEDEERHASRSLRRHALYGAVATLVLLGGAGGWAATAEIAGAVIAPATVTVESNAKKVQHLEGGIVSQILVREGQHVDAGDLLLQLDATETRVEAAVLAAQIDELVVEQARLRAELVGDDRMELPPTLADHGSKPRVTRMVEEQRDLLRSRAQTLAGQKEQLGEQVSQLAEQIAGMRAQLASKERQTALAAGELEDLERLSSKGLVQKGRVLALERQIASLEGERGQIVAEIARLGGRISETRLKVLQLDEERRSEALARIGEVRGQLSSLREQRAAAEAKVARTQVLAPRAGRVHALAVHTVGGVLAAGEAAMLVVPDGDALVLEARVAPQDVDQLRAGQAARVRFSAFDQRSTPELAAEIIHVGADLTLDPATQLAHFEVRLAVPDEEIERLGDNRLRPGMPAEAFVQTERRTALSYLAKPLTDQVTRAFRE